MKRIFICSPYRGWDMEHNIEIAKRMCIMAIEKGHAPFAPHLLYPQLLDDNDPEQREAGILAGLHFMSTCQELWCYTGKGISEGMQMELDRMRFLRSSGQKIRLKNFDAITEG